MEILICTHEGEEIHAELPVRASFFDLLQRSDPSHQIRIIIVKTGQIKFVPIREISPTR